MTPLSCIVRNRRKELALTQEALAERARVSLSTVKHLERDDWAQTFYFRTLDRVESALELPVGALAVAFSSSDSGGAA